MYVYTHVYMLIDLYIDINIHLIYTNAYPRAHTHTQTLHFFPLVSVNQPLRCYELHLLFHKDDRLVLALCGASTAPHSHRN